MGERWWHWILYNDNLCLWRCIVVHRSPGVRLDRCIKAPRLLAQSFFKLSVAPKDCPKTPLDQLDQVERHLNQGKLVSDWLAIRVYEPELEADGEVIWHLRWNPSDKLKNILTIGVYDGHAFVIKDIATLAKTYVCVNCQARFTKVCNLKRHAETCTQGETVIVCPNERVEAPQTAYEKAFYLKNTASFESLRWLEREAERRKTHIHHAMCGHGGERWVERVPVDGYEPLTKTVFQYHGCHWHGCPQYHRNDRDRIVAHNKTREQCYQATVERTRIIII